MKILSAYPLYPYQCSVTVKGSMVEITVRQAFSYHTYTLNIGDISDISVAIGIFFARLTLSSGSIGGKKIIVGGLWKKEAIYMGRAIGGIRLHLSK
jgi:hypothetical protein